MNKQRSGLDLSLKTTWSKLNLNDWSTFPSTRTITEWRLPNGSVLHASFLDVRDIGTEQDECDRLHEVSPTDCLHVAQANGVEWLGPQLTDQNERVAWRCPQCGSAWTESTTPVVSPPYWVRIKRTGDLFEGFHSPDGVTWTKEGDISISMAQKVLIGLCVTSHAAGELRTFEFDNLSYVGDIAGQIYSSDPMPADGAIFPQTYATLGWTAGYSAVTHDIYFGESLADVETGTGLH